MALLWLAPLLIRIQSCPFGLHDWSWPCYPDQASSLAVTMAPWSEDNLGVPNSRPIVNPLWLLLILAAHLSPLISLKVFLFTVTIAAAIGADLAAARLFGVISPWARLASGLLYVSAPFFAVKLESGHLNFLLAGATLPFLLVAFESSIAGSRRALATAGFLSATMLVQIQAGLIGLVLLPLIAFRRAKSMNWAIVWAIALAAWLPSLFAALVAFTSGALSTERQLSVWLNNQSIPWNRTLDGTWYFADYYGSASGLPSVVAWQWFAPLAIIVALLTAGLSRRLAVAALALGIFAMGMRGPLAAPIGWLAAHFPPALLYREFYDLLFLAPLVISGGAALALDRLLRVRERTPWGALAGGAVFVAIAGLLLEPAITGAAARAIPLADPSRWSDEVRTVASLPGYARILWLPNEIPLGPPSSPGGADPFYWSFGSHASAAAYHPSGIFAYAASMADHVGKLPVGLARRLGIGEIFVRSGLVSRRLSLALHPAGGVIRPPQRNPQRISSAGPLALSYGEPACEPDLRSAMIAAATYVRCKDPAWVTLPQEDPATSGDDPLHDWVSGERWAALDPELADPRWPVLATRSSATYSWRVPSDGYAWIYAPDGAVLDDRPLAPAAQWEVYRIGRDTHSLHGNGKGLVAISASLPRIVSNRPPPGNVEAKIKPTAVHHYWGRFEVALPAHGPGTLILREGWSRYWSASIAGQRVGMPELTDGYAAGWRLPRTDRPSIVTIHYSLAAPYAMLAAISAVVWVALLLIMTYSDRVGRSAQALTF